MKRSRPTPALFLLAALAGCSAPREPHHIEGTVSAVDGDTISVKYYEGAYSRQKKEFQIRLQHIDAPEMPGHCFGYRAATGTCAPGDPYRSKGYLQFLLEQGPLYCKFTGKDVYERYVGDCEVNSMGLSMSMLEAGLASPYYYRRKPA